MNTKDKEVRERFLKTIMDNATARELELIDVFLSELTRRENEVWREASNLSQNMKKRNSDIKSIFEYEYNSACSDISSALLSRVREDNKETR